MPDFDWTAVHTHILQFEARGLVTRTFRRLDPDRQRAVIDAILAEAVEKGPASINIKEVARRAGVSVGSLYQYFDNREGLLAFAVELCVRFVVDQFREYGPMMAEMPLRDGLSMYMAGGLEWGETMAGLVMFYARAAYQGDPGLAESVVRPVADAMRQTVAAMLARAVTRGEVRPDVDIEAAARVIHALTIAVGDPLMLPYLNTYFQVTGEGMPSERTIQAMLDLVLSGIGPSEHK